MSELTASTLLSPNTTRTHTPCGADLEVVLSCGVRAEPMTRSTIALAGESLSR
jgi:hypothetical protein